MFIEDHNNGEGGGDKPCNSYIAKAGAMAVPMLIFDGNICNGCKSHLRDAQAKIYASFMEKAQETFSKYIEHVNKEHSTNIMLEQLNTSEARDILKDFFIEEKLEELLK